MKPLNETLEVARAIFHMAFVTCVTSPGDWFTVSRHVFRTLQPAGRGVALVLHTPHARSSGGEAGALREGKPPF